MPPTSLEEDGTLQSYAEPQYSPDDNFTRPGGNRDLSTLDAEQPNSPPGDGPAKAISSPAVLTSDPDCRLFVSELPPTMNRNTLTKVFRRYPGFKYTNLYTIGVGENKRSKCEGHVVFSDKAAAERAWRTIMRDGIPGYEFDVCLFLTEEQRRLRSLRGADDEIEAEGEDPPLIQLEKRQVHHPPHQNSECSNKH